MKERALDEILVKDLGGLNPNQLFPWRGLHDHPLAHPLDGVLEGDGRGRRPDLRRLAHGAFNDLPGDQRAGSVVDGGQTGLFIGGLQAGEHRLGPGFAPGHDGGHLVQLIGPAQGVRADDPLLPDDYHDFVNTRAVLEDLQGAQQHRFSAQGCRQLIGAAHAAGAPGGHDDRRAIGTFGLDEGSREFA